MSIAIGDCNDCPRFRELMDLALALAAASSKCSSDLKPGEIGEIIADIQKMQRNDA